MRKLSLLFLAFLLTTGIPLVHADDGGKPAEEEKEPECD